MFLLKIIVIQFTGRDECNKQALRTPLYPISTVPYLKLHIKSIALFGLKVVVCIKLSKNLTNIFRESNCDW